MNHFFIKGYEQGVVQNGKCIKSGVLLYLSAVFLKIKVISMVFYFFLGGTGSTPPL